MNEFLSQFLIECREFVEQASEGLLKLERASNDAELLDGVFRAFHTLKGGAGIVDFADMERAVHAAEGVLSDARAGRQVLTSASMEDCLNCLDQVSRWLDTIERTGELPADSAPEAQAIIQRFGALTQAASTTVGAGDTEPTWIKALLERQGKHSGRARSAIHFIPDPDCFYQGEDPVARILSVPQLLAIDLTLADASPALRLMDAFRCALVITALTESSVADVTRRLHEVSGELQVMPLGAIPEERRNSGISARAAAVIHAQLALLAELATQHSIGRTASAGRTAANVLRFSHQLSLVERVTQATEQSIAEGSPRPLQEALERALTQDQAPAAPAEPAATAATRQFSARTLRIDATRIDALVRLTSELTVAKNAVAHLAKLAQEQGNTLTSQLRDRHAVLEHLVGELQAQVLGMRVLPLRTVFQRFPRVVRDLSAAIGKQVTLNIEGDDTEADKAIVEMLFEPVLHVIRNALDHGIEAPELRVQRGKSAPATIRIKAAREGGRVVIQISDDGSGVDLARVRQVALARGVVPADVVTAMSDAEVIELIFAPGFSTATQITELSGRGVGMDAVRTAVERIGGRVTMVSTQGMGSTVEFSLPFSVMMTHVMTVEAGEQIFGIPLDAIVETVKVPHESIVKLGAAQAIVVRERTIPVLQLANSLGYASAPLGSGDATIVITASAGQLAGIQVDRLGEQLEVILQPLDGLLSGTPGITGTTLLGDGRVLLVLDMGAMLV